MPRTRSIDLYLTGVVYRDRLLVLARVLVAAAIVADRAELERVAGASRSANIDDLPGGGRDRRSAAR